MYLQGRQLLVGLHTTEIMSLALKGRPLFRIALAHKPFRRMGQDDILLYLITDLFTALGQGTVGTQPLWPVAIQHTAPFVDVFCRLALSKTRNDDTNIQRAK